MEQNHLEVSSGFEMAQTMHGKYLTFWIEEQLYGVPISDVVQIIGVQEITEVPEFPYYAKGIVNLRGSIIPVIDVRLRFGKMEIPYDERTCIIVTSINKVLTGFIVDSVDEVTDISDEEITPPPKASVEYADTYLTSIGKPGDKLVLLLDANKIIGEEIFGRYQM